MHGNNTENRAVVHGLNTYAITNDTQNTAHHEDVIDVEWEDVNSDHTSQAPRNNNTNLSKANTRQQEKIINDLFNIARPNETVSLTISRQSTRPTQAPMPPQHTNRYDDGENTDGGISEIMFILWVLLCVAVVAVLIKVAEFILEHPTTVFLGLIATACLVGSYFLLKTNRGKHL